MHQRESCCTPPPLRAGTAAARGRCRAGWRSAWSCSSRQGGAPPTQRGGWANGGLWPSHSSQMRELACNCAHRFGACGVAEGGVFVGQQIATCLEDVSHRCHPHRPCPPKHKRTSCPQGNASHLIFSGAHPGGGLRATSEANAMADYALSLLGEGPRPSRWEAPRCKRMLGAGLWGPFGRLWREGYGREGRAGRLCAAARGPAPQPACHAPAAAFLGPAGHELHLPLPLRIHPIACPHPPPPPPWAAGCWRSGRRRRAPTRSSASP